MGTCLKIGNQFLDGDRIISALVQYQLLETLVGHILLDESIQNVPLSKQDIFYALVGATNEPIPEDFEAFLTQWCDRQGVSSAYLQGVMLRELRVKKFKQLSFADQVESEFLRTKSSFDQVEYSLIQLADLLLVEELYFQLRDDGTSFVHLAQQYSLGNERHTGGRVGPVPLATLPEEVAILFRREQVGTVCAPLLVGDRYWIIRLDRLTTAHLTETIRATLINQIYNQWLQSQVKELVATPNAIAVLEQE